MKQTLELCLQLLDKAADGLRSPLILLTRLYWGWQFAETGWGKIGNIAKVTDFFTTLGIPFPGLNAHFIAGLEFGGGILMAVGLFSRPIGFLLTANMLVAYITADREALFSFLSDPDKFTGASPFTFLVASLVLLAAGPGLFSVDAWLKRPARQRTTSGLPATA